MVVKRVCIIGAGVSGLTSIKCCLDEGLEPTCYEQSEDIGGLWRYKEEAAEGQASVYRSLVINTSKEMMCFSDFPIPRNFPNYMSHSMILQYFQLFVERFNLMKHILFKRKVTAVTKRVDFAISGQWNVTVVDENGKEESTVFDAVMVCIGHHVNKHLPLDSFPGIDRFMGRYIHSREYKEPWEYKDKRVLVIGIGNSGGDIAVEVSRHAAQVYLSTRRGAWVLNRVSHNGYPIDIVISRRYLSLIPKPLLNFLGERQLNSRFNHSNYGLQPSHRFRSQHPTINDDLPNRIITGSVIVKTNVAEFSETGLAKLPDCTTMKNDTAEKREAMAKRYMHSQRHTIQVDYITYMDEIGELIGVKPHFLPLFLQDPGLALSVFLGPCTPFQFRLQGPGQWEGAAQAIRTQWDRVLAPTRTRVATLPSQVSGLPSKLFSLLALIVAVALVLWVTI
uniref:flavin-containing monooxygenase 5-like isoform X2 n=1 Tax=Myxine glutinosa TaxID=7769 RepID=UPI00358E06BA